MVTAEEGWPRCPLASVDGSCHAGVWALPCHTLTFKKSLKSDFDMKFPNLEVSAMSGKVVQNTLQARQTVSAGRACAQLVASLPRTRGFHTRRITLLSSQVLCLQLCSCTAATLLAGAAHQSSGRGRKHTGQSQALPHSLSILHVHRVRSRGCAFDFGNCHSVAQGLTLKRCWRKRSPRLCWTLCPEQSPL